MATYLLTVRAAVTDNLGLRLSPGIRPSQMKDQPAIRQMTMGAELELRRPDGTSLRSVLGHFAISLWKGEDGALYLHDTLTDPEIELTIWGDVSPEKVPAGTEVWLL